MIRDIFIIVFTGLAILVLLVGGFLVFGLLRSIRGTVRNAEEVTSIIVNKVARPLSNIPAVADVVRTVVGLVQEYRSRERRNEDGETE
jgi:hypothetical protein